MFSVICSFIAQLLDQVAQLGFLEFNVYCLFTVALMST